MSRKGPCLSHETRPPGFAVAETVLERLRDLSKVTELVSGRPGTRTLHACSRLCTRAWRSSRALDTAPARLLHFRASRQALGAVSQCRCLQASSVSSSGLGPELHQAGSLNEMAPKFLKWFNKTYTVCNVQFIVGNYCPSVGKNDLQSVILLSAS